MQRIGIAIVVAICLAAAAKISATEPSVAGRWTGTSKVRCGTLRSSPQRCNAVQSISFDLTQTGSKISGEYTCAFGTQDCIGLAHKGTVTEGTISGLTLQFAVNLGNGSTCRFKGGLKQDEIQGSYSYRGVTAPEHGTWRVHRASAGAPVPTPQASPLLAPLLH
jgi:hypothetical protein